MILRDYQEKASLDIRMALKEYNHNILCLPTRAGKTVIATNIVDRACKKNLTSLFLCDRDFIIEQTFKHFTRAGISCQILTAKTKAVYKTPVTIAMVETFHRRLSKGWFNDIKFDLIICDEAHISTHNKIIEKFPDTYVIGLTATPVASQQNYPLKKNYQNIVLGPTVPWLISKGHLVPSIDIGHQHLLDFKVMAGEFSTLSQKEQWEKFDLDNVMFKLWGQHASDRQTIVYNQSIEHNEKVYNLFKENGIDTDFVTGETSKEERKEKLQRYESGRTQVIHNIGVYTKGFDSPQTSCIIGNISTTSLSKWIQLAGRGATPCEGKNNFITIDMGNNILLHGSYNDSIDWKAIFWDEARDKNFTVKKKPKLCNICFAYIWNIHEEQCNVCHKPIIIKELLDLEDQIPDEIKDKNPDDMTLSELYQYAKYKGFKKGYAWLTHMRNIGRKQNKIEK